MLPFRCQNYLHSSESGNIEYLFLAYDMTESSDGYMLLSYSGGGGDDFYDDNDDYDDYDDDDDDDDDDYDEDYDEDAYYEYVGDDDDDDDDESSDAYSDEPDPLDSDSFVDFDSLESEGWL